VRRGFPADPAVSDACQKRITCLAISFIIHVCCRAISPVQKPRAAPAQALAALSQALIHGLRNTFSFSEVGATPDRRSGFLSPGLRLVPDTHMMREPKHLGPVQVAGQ
jgi:hypothetical protein